MPVVGAGASIPIGGPDWLNYLRMMAEGLPNEFKALVTDASGNATEVASLLEEERRRRHLPRVPVKFGAFSQIHQALTTWNCPLYLTTNFDNCLEAAFRTRGDCDVLCNDQLSAIDLTRAAGPPIVVKLCSSSSDLQTGAVSREDFANLLHRQRSALELLVTVMRTFVVVFIGCGMRDPVISAAVDRFHAEGVGCNRHFVLLPDTASKSQTAALENLGVDSVLIPSQDRTQSLLTFIKNCARRGAGQHRLLVFEPSRITKARQIFEAIRSVARTRSIARIGVITENPELAYELPKLQKEYCPNIDCDVIPVRSTADTNSVIAAVQEKSRHWTAIVAPYEYATRDAAELAKNWFGTNTLEFHSPETASLSRDKRRFRRFISENFSEGTVITPTKYESIPIGVDTTPEMLLANLEGFRGWSDGRLVIKPPDAASSIAVRAIDLRNREECIRSLTEVLNIIHAMPVETETARCETSELLVEEFLGGEEFSVESRQVQGEIETLGVHWKVDIDSDGKRFFERIFVTLPQMSREYRLLDDVNRKLLRAMDVRDGVFHAEYRIDLEHGRIFPIEVGLRPGGGMVTYSIYVSRGVDLFEASVRCALGIQKNEANCLRTVATGLIFASQPGILPPLRVRDQHLGELAIQHGDEKSLREYLQRYLRRASRAELVEKTYSLLNRKNDLCSRTTNSLSKEANPGLRADLKLVEVWMRPGTAITEEEATYVAGLLATTAEEHPSEAAVAECICAMKSCLDNISCEPEPALSLFSWRSLGKGDLPQWWTKAMNHGYRDDIDSWTFSTAITNAIDDGAATGLLDLGCGSARPVLKAIERGLRYAGVDIDNEAIRDAEYNFRGINGATAAVVIGDVCSSEWLSRLAVRSGEARGWQIVAANLPYLPSEPGSGAHKDVDGGTDGLRYIPDRVLEIAAEVGATRIILNLSSLCNVPEFCKRLADAGYGVTKIVATLAPLGKFSLRGLDYIRAQSFTRLFGTGSELRQIIYACEIQRGRGVPFDVTVQQIENLLRPEANSLGSMLFGATNW